MMDTMDGGEKERWTIDNIHPTIRGQWMDKQGTKRGIHKVCSHTYTFLHTIEGKRL